MEIIRLEYCFGLGDGEFLHKNHQFCKGTIFKNKVIRMLFNKVRLQIVDEIFKNQFVK